MVGVELEPIDNVQVCIEAIPASLQHAHSDLEGLL